MGYFGGNPILVMENTMFYATQDQNTLVIVAADTVETFEGLPKMFPEWAVEKDGKQAKLHVAVLQIFSDYAYRVLSKQPIAIDFDDTAELELFVKEQQVKIIHPNDGESKQKLMLDELQYRSEKDKTLAEIYDLNVEDPFAEQKEANGGRDGGTKAKGKGPSKLAADGSFAANDESRKLQARGLTVNNKGEVISASYTKLEEDDENEERPTIDPNYEINNFHKIDIYDKKIEDVKDLLNIPTSPFNYGDTEYGCWVAYFIERLAKKAQTRLEDAGIICFTYQSDNYGDPKTAPEPKEILPRAWNEKASEIDTMTEEELKELKKNIKAGEYYVSMYKVDGAVNKNYIFICPVSYFEENKKLYDGDIMFDFGKRLESRKPTLVEPNVYMVESTQDIVFTLEQEVFSAGFHRSMEFDAHIIEVYIHGIEA